MADGSSKLAGLVTQAPPDDDPDAGKAAGGNQWAQQREPAQQQQQQRKGKAGGWSLCGCFKPPRDPSSSSSTTNPARPISQGSAPRNSGEGRRQEKERDEPPQLGPQIGANIGRKCLVLDLDETLVHSSFRVVPGADIVISVEIEGESHKVYVRKRPGVDEFLAAVAEYYEIVIYTASMAKYANPLIDQLDVNNVCAFRLFREACTRAARGYVKDLSRLGRNLKSVIIVDNSPSCYALQPDNAIPIKTWRDDPTDRELLDLVTILRALVDVDDIPAVLKQIIGATEEDDYNE